VKFKMAENSLFAILLRSPWWISFAVAAVLVTASFGALPKEYALFGAIGCLPFLVIGGMALSRQWGLPSAKETEARLAQIAAMSWTAFSAELESALQKDGYTVQRVSGAADLRLEKAGRTTLVGAKRWKAARPGAEPLRELDAARQAQDADDAMFIALGELSDKGRDFARQHGIRVVQGADLAALLRS
jgi:restriction system protein